MTRTLVNYIIRKVKRLVRCKRKRLANNTYLTGGRVKDLQTVLEVKNYQREVKKEKE